MSYALYDHAAWVERHIAAMKEKKPKRVRLGIGYAYAPKELTPFQRQVFTILGIAGAGIYNAPIAWEAIKWSTADRIFIPWNAVAQSLSTFDTNNLTELVFLCHDACIRLNIYPHGPSYFLLVFSKRAAKRDEYSFHDSHPTLEEAVRRYRYYIPMGHDVVDHNRGER